MDEGEESNLTFDVVEISAEGLFSGVFEEKFSVKDEELMADGEW